MQAAHVLLDATALSDAKLTVIALIPILSRMTSNVVIHIEEVALDETTQRTSVLVVGRQRMKHDVLE